MRKRFLRSTTLAIFCLAAALGSNAWAAGGSVRFVNYVAVGKFSVKIPVGWRVTETFEGVKISDPSGESFAFIAPFFSKSKLTSDQFLKALPDLDADQFPNCRVASISNEQGAVDNAVASLTLGSQSKAVALCSICDRSGMLYLIAAPNSEFSAERTRLVHVLQTFTYDGHGGVQTASLGPDLKSFSPNKLDNYIRGQVDVYDPATHATWKTTAGYNYYWGRCGANEIGGTNAFERPNTNLDPLLEY